MKRWAVGLLGLCCLTSSQAAEPLPFKLFDGFVHFSTADFAHFPLYSPPALANLSLPPDLATRIQNNPADVERVLKTWDENGIEAGVGMQYRSAYYTDNSYLIDLTTRHANRVVPVVLVEPLDPNTPYIMYGMAARSGLAGVRFFDAPDPASQDYPSLTRRADATWRAASTLGLTISIVAAGPVAFEPDPALLKAVAQMAQRYPKVKIVLDHFAMIGPVHPPDYGLTPEHLALKAYPNVYLKMTSVVLERMGDEAARAHLLRRAVDVFGADRILWGSDLGNSALPFARLVEIAVSATAQLTPAEQRKVLHDTGKAVYTRHRLPQP